MNIGETFSRSWEITKKSFSVIMQDKEIIIFPILASFFSIIFFLAMAIPFLLADIMQQLGVERLGGFIVYVVIFAFYLGLSFISTFFNVAVVYSAKKRFEGGNPTFFEGMSESFKKIHLIFFWSILSATVGLLLRMLESSAKRSRNDLGRMIGSFAVGILGTAWSIASIFVVPAIVFDNVGPFKALKISVESIKKTWGESLIRHYGLGFAQTLFILGGIVLLLVPGILLMFAAPIVGLVIIGIFVVYTMVVFLLFGTANTIYNTALFMYASKGKLPHAFTHEEIKGAFKEEHQKHHGAI